MKRILLSLAAAAAVVVVVALGGGAGETEARAPVGPRAISVLGVAQVQGQEAFVDVWVVVPPGANERAVADAALAGQGARPAEPGDLSSLEFGTTGLVWNQFFDSDPNNNYVTQNYNPDGDPTGGDGEAALTNTHATWTNVVTSSFAFQYGGQTSRCPSLVAQCPGPQFLDGFHDVGWADLGSTGVLGVTWFSVGADEADMALNTTYGWHGGPTRCTNQPGTIDAETVLLHENGHVVGLAHSDIPQAVMYYAYGGARCQLHQDDVDGVTFLYPSVGATPSPTSTPVATPSPSPTPTVPDSDGDGCTDAQELGSDPALGGTRDPANPWDFFDVPVPTLHEGGTLADRDRAVTIVNDMLAVLVYSGAANDGPPNSGGVDYDEDMDRNRVDDGRAYDRSVGPVWSDAPNGAITIVEDVLLVLAQSGHSCLG